ncbi:MAG: rRNA maturation RNase YbeY [Balneolaceae bacterium]|nr:rRNA maturation RNase YbeY [Balneolaceae bacterium]MBO6546281.1 rRNA maturation RNase YbeY [Balneolaceae bacterium]MBO6648640.1 rRNA maturation RNase YbeY [Balneolaceae bacterium]
METPDHPLQLFNTSGLELPFKESEAAFLLDVIREHQSCNYSFVEVVFVDEKEIVRINKEFLGRDYVTDIISFRYDEDTTNMEIEGTLYCCTSRIQEQAKEYCDSEKQEFLRIIVHGLIHLIGYDDQTPEEKAEMTRLENHYLKMHLDS